ncbi:MAG: hypothetical protein ACFFED_01835 [Candidatus Thorarchaeota archaeon]
MTKTYTKTTLSTMTLREMFSLWWKERWVRGLVLAISPIGLVDAMFTLLLFQAHGPEFEYNPLVRLALISDWWFIWIVIDIVSFVVFAMIAGSYYIHTRSSIFGNHIGWLAGLVGIRVGIVFYNVLLYYGDPYPMFWGGIMTFLSFVAVAKLLTRETNVSWKGFKWFFLSKYHRLHDRLLTKGTVKTPVEEEPKTTSMAPVDMEMDNLGLWLQKAGYLSMAILVFVSIPFVLSTVGVLTGGIFWTEIYGEGFYWNELSAGTFVIGFITIIILISIMMYFILKAFSTKGGAW